MKIILVPGFWLDASSWAHVLPPIEAAGHEPIPVTLPGLESPGADRSGIGLHDHIDSVVRLIDRLGEESDEPVVLTGHSGGGPIAYGAVDQRPDRIARAIYVDSGPLAAGASINDALPFVDDEIPLPEWDFFDDADLTDLDEGTRAQFRARAIPQPRGVAYDAMSLSDDPRRLGVPATVIACEFPSETMRELIAAGHPYVAELARLSDYEIVDLPTGHWPQFTRPAELGALIADASSR